MEILMLGPLRDVDILHKKNYNIITKYYNPIFNNLPNFELTLVTCIENTSHETRNKEYGMQ